MHNSHEEWVQQQRVAALATARQILAGDIGVVEGSRRLSALQHALEPSALEEFFTPFVAIASQTDHLPLGEVTKHWAPDALDEKRKELAEAERLHRQDAFEACRGLINRLEQDV